MTNIEGRPHAPVFRYRSLMAVRLCSSMTSESMAARCSYLADLAEKLVAEKCKPYGLNPETLSPSPILALERARSERECDPLVMALAQAAVTQ